MKEIRPWNIKSEPSPWIKPKDKWEPDDFAKHIYKTVYNTRRWQRVRANHLLHFPLCDQCMNNKRTTQATVVDHILSIRQGGGAWDVMNYQSLCKEHHKTKQNQERHENKINIR